MPTRISPEDFARHPITSHTTNVASSALGSRILAVTDEFFAEAANLLTPTPPVREANKFVETGAWYDGWETRRHNANPYDAAIIQLGLDISARVWAVEVDTAYFNGNHAPAVQLLGLPTGATIDPAAPDAYADPRWEEILPVLECGPSQRHIWLLDAPTAHAYHTLQLRQFPDGGIARLLVHASVEPNFPDDPDAIVDLAAIQYGGVVTSFSDAHFGRATNLLLPGRGHNMGDGWETARSRVPGHVDWVVVRLGAPAKIEEVTVDTLHFRGNFPREVKLHAVDWRGRDGEPDGNDQGVWTEIVQGEKCKADKVHAFPSDRLQVCGEGNVYTHVRMTIVPDGGVKRLRVFGKRAL